MTEPSDAMIYPGEQLMTELRTLLLSRSTISRLIWLCEKEVDRLRVFARNHSDDPNSEDDVSDAENDATFWKVVVMALRSAREKPKP